VRAGLRNFTFSNSAASRHDALFELIGRLHALVRVRASTDHNATDSEDQVVADLTVLIEADEPLVRSLLPQLCAIALRAQPPLAQLEWLLVAQSSGSHQFAMECCWTLLAERAPSDAALLARADALLLRVENAGRIAMHATEGGAPLRRTLSGPLGQRALRRPRGEPIAAPATAAVATAASAPGRATAGAEPAGEARKRAISYDTLPPRGSPVRARAPRDSPVRAVATVAAVLLAADEATTQPTVVAVALQPTPPALADAPAPVPAPAPAPALSELRLLHELVAISHALKATARPSRARALHLALGELDARLQAQMRTQTRARRASTWHATPLRTAATPATVAVDAPLRVVRVCAAEARVFSTKERAPFMVHLELVSTLEPLAPSPSAEPPGGPAGRLFRTRAMSTTLTLPSAPGARTLRRGSTTMLDTRASERQVSASPSAGDAAAARPMPPGFPLAVGTPPPLPPPPPPPAQGASGSGGAGGSRSGGSAGAGASAPSAAVAELAAQPPDEPGDECAALASLTHRNLVLRTLPREISGGGDSAAADDADADGDARADGGAASFRSTADVFGAPFEAMQARLARGSEYAALPGWQVLTVVVKAGDELRQERFAMELIRTFDAIFRRAGLPLALRPYRIVASGPDCGLLEGINDALTLDALKQRAPHCASLDAFFHDHFGSSRRPAYHRARLNFARSAAAYSVVCYLLQIKDRHNGNIMLTSDGCATRLRRRRAPACSPRASSSARPLTRRCRRARRSSRASRRHLVHIDFGFLLSNSPGGNLNFESAPFKLTHEYVELLGGTHSPLYRYFRYLVVRGFVEARRHRDKVLLLVQTTLDFGGARWPCFRAGQAAVEALRARFKPDMSMQQYTNHVIELINTAQGSVSTRCYDGYQYCCQGIA
jgi:phosphatidylinositol 4-kinase